ncbi:hypothetical protein C8R43DRAFT_942206 [Mycena crocata]|nr:hypothetical protein C8R43DRAFT_942206 [Mycena crocata]
MDKYDSVSLADRLSHAQDAHVAAVQALDKHHIFWEGERQRHTLTRKQRKEEDDALAQLTAQAKAAQDTLEDTFHAAQGRVQSFVHVLSNSSYWSVLKAPPPSTPAAPAPAEVSTPSNLAAPPGVPAAAITEVSIPPHVAAPPNPAALGVMEPHEPPNAPANISTPREASVDREQTHAGRGMLSYLGQESPATEPPATTDVPMSDLQDHMSEDEASIDARPAARDFDDYNANDYVDLDSEDDQRTAGLSLPPRQLYPELPSAGETSAMQDVQFQASPPMQPVLAMEDVRCSIAPRDTMLRPLSSHAGTSGQPIKAENDNGNPLGKGSVPVSDDNMFTMPELPTPKVEATAAAITFAATKGSKKRAAKEASVQYRPQLPRTAAEIAAAKQSSAILKKWHVMPEQQKLAMKTNGAAALQTMLQQQLKTGKCGRMPMHKDLAAYIRDVETLCPEAGSLSRQIFQEVHRTSGANNYVCSYHHVRLDSKDRLVDGDPTLAFEINGHPAPYSLVGSETAGPAPDADADESDHILQREEVALGFFFTKQNLQLTKDVYSGAHRKADSSLGHLDPNSMKEVSEGMGGDLLNPRQCTFLVALLKKGGFTIKVIYQGGVSAADHQMRIMELRMEYLLDEFELAARGCGQLQKGWNVRVLWLNARETAQVDGEVARKAALKMKDPSPDYHVLFDDLRYNNDNGKAARFYKTEERRKHMFSMIGARSSQALERAADMAVEPEEVPEGETLRHREIFYAANLQAHMEPQQWIRDWAPDALQTVSRLRAKSIVATRKALPVEVLAEILNWSGHGSREGSPRFASHGSDASSTTPASGPTCSSPLPSGGTATIGRDTSRSAARLRRCGGGGPPPSKEQLMLEGLKTRMERAGGLPLDVVLAGDEKLAPMMLEVLVKASNRWGTFRLKSPENVAPGVVANVGGTLLDESATEHPWFPELAQIRGRLPRLRSLALEGHYFRGRWSSVQPNTLWQGETVAPRDVIRWFDDAPLLQEVILLGIFLPEETLLLQWEQIQKYREERTCRKKALPLSHLRRMSNVKEIIWDDVFLTADESETATLPLLTSMVWSLQRRPNSDIGTLELYDRLLPLSLPALGFLQLDGDGFDTGSEATPDIATSIKLLVDRGCNLVTLELDALTGITAAGAVVLLTQIPTLKSFWLKEVADKEGIMTKVFLHSLKTVPVTVDFLKIEGARGLPASPEDLGLLRQLSWLDSLLGMLALQYDHKLSTLDIQYGFKFTNLCPFTKASHALLEERLGKFFEMGKKLVVHREGEECSNADWPNHQFSTPEEATDTEEEDDDEEEEGLESDAYENGVSVDGASDENLEL